MNILNETPITELFYYDYSLTEKIIKSVKNGEILGIVDLSPPLRNINKFKLSKYEPHIVFLNDIDSMEIPVADIIDIKYL
jgi:hypothetical protein